MNCESCALWREQPNCGHYNFQCEECSKRYLAEMWAPPDATETLTGTCRREYQKHRAALQFRNWLDVPEIEEAVIERMANA